MVTLNSKVTDPNLLIKGTPSDITIGFRVCPLPGGGKQDFTQAIAQTLRNRGVPNDSVDDRVKSILATQRTRDNILGVIEETCL